MKTSIEFIKRREDLRQDIILTIAKHSSEGNYIHPSHPISIDRLEYRWFDKQGLQNSLGLLLYKNMSMSDLLYVLMTVEVYKIKE